MASITMRAASQRRQPYALTRQFSQYKRVNDVRGTACVTWCGRLPELQELKRRLQEDSGGAFEAVFMTGSGSTIVCVGSHEVGAGRSRSRSLAGQLPHRHP